MAIKEELLAVREENQVLREQLAQRDELIAQQQALLAACLVFRFMIVLVGFAVIVLVSYSTLTWIASNREVMLFKLS